jgi:hypothetical protein
MKNVLLLVASLFLSMNAWAKVNTPQVQSFMFTVPNSQLLTAPVVTNLQNPDKYECMSEATRMAGLLFRQLTFLELNSKTTPYQVRTVRIENSTWGTLESYLFSLETQDERRRVHLQYAPGFTCQLVTVSNL